MPIKMDIKIAIKIVVMKCTVNNTMLLVLDTSHSKDTITACVKAYSVNLFLKR